MEMLGLHVTTQVIPLLSSKVTQTAVEREVSQVQTQVGT